jgi:hypothetical protein
MERRELAFEHDISRGSGTARSGALEAIESFGIIVDEIVTDAVCADAGAQARAMGVVSRGDGSRMRLTAVWVN